MNFPSLFSPILFNNDELGNEHTLAVILAQIGWIWLMLLVKMFGLVGREEMDLYMWMMLQLCAHFLFLLVTFRTIYSLDFIND